MTRLWEGGGLSYDDMVWMMQPGSMHFVLGPAGGMLGAASLGWGRGVCEQQRACCVGVGGRAEERGSQNSVSGRLDRVRVPSRGCCCCRCQLNVQCCWYVTKRRARQTRGREGRGEGCEGNGTSRPTDRPTDRQRRARRLRRRRKGGRRTNKEACVAAGAKLRASVNCSAKVDYSGLKKGLGCQAVAHSLSSLSSKGWGKKTRGKIDDETDGWTDRRPRQTHPTKIENSISGGNSFHPTSFKILRTVRRPTFRNSTAQQLHIQHAGPVLVHLPSIPPPSLCLVAARPPLTQPWHCMA